MKQSPPGNAPSFLQKPLASLIQHKKTLIPVVLVFFLPVLLYLHTLGFGFVYFDDHDLILNNLSFLSDPANLPRVFVKDASLAGNSRFYRPLQTASYMADILLAGGGGGWMHHFTNIILFGLNAVALFLFLKRFRLPDRAAAAGTLLFCVHPLFTFLVSWIPSRGDLLLSLFSLLSFIFFIEYLDKKKPLFLFLQWIGFTLALFCKETAALLPVLFIMYFFIFSRERPVKKEPLFVIGLSAVSGALWFGLRSIALGGASAWEEASGAALLSNLRTIPEALANFFFPFTIALIPSFTAVKTIIGLGLLAGIIILFFMRTEATKKEKAFYLLWFLLLMLPGMVVKEAFIDYLQHRFFLPLIGVLLFICRLAPERLHEAIGKRLLVTGAVSVLSVFFVVITVINTRLFADPMTFWNTAVAQHPDNPLTFNNRGYVKEINGDLAGALNDYADAVKRDPSFVPAYFNSGNVFTKRGDVRTAIEYYQKAAALNPRNADIPYNMGNIYAAQADYEQAIREYNNALALQPQYAAAFNNRGLAYQARGDQESALRDFNHAIAAAPEFAAAYYNRGTLFLSRGDINRALDDFVTATALNPHYAEAYNNLGLARRAAGDLEGAFRDFDKAVSLKPDMAEAHYNRGNYFFVKGALKNALADYDAAIALKPDYAQAYGIRGAAYAAAGDLDAAIRDLRKAIELNPNDAMVYGYLGSAYKAKGNAREAERYIALFEKLTGEKP